MAKKLIPLSDSRSNLTLANEHATENYANGFACPDCDTELMDIAPLDVLESIPAQVKVCCPKCSFKKTRYVSND